MVTQLLNTLKGLIGFFIIWIILLILSPFLIAILCGQYAKTIIAAKKVDKVVDTPKVLAYVPATKDNNVHSYN